MDKHNHTLCTSSQSSEDSSSPQFEEESIDAMLAKYRSKEAQRSRSYANEIGNTNLPSPWWKNEHGNTTRAILNRIGGSWADLWMGKARGGLEDNLTLRRCVIIEIDS
jgi:hypothetical protein